MHTLMQMIMLCHAFLCAWFSFASPTAALAALLINRHQKRVEVIHPRLERRLVVHTLHLAGIRPQGPQRPRADLRVGTHTRAGEVRGVEGCGRDRFLHPVDHHGQVCLWPWAVGLVGVGVAVRAAGDEVEAVPVAQGGGAGVVALSWVHDLSDGLPVVHGGGGGDGVVRFAAGGC